MSTPAIRIVGDLLDWEIDATDESAPSKIHRLQAHGGVVAAAVPLGGAPVDGPGQRVCALATLGKPDINICPPRGLVGSPRRAQLDVVGRPTTLLFVQPFPGEVQRIDAEVFAGIDRTVLLLGGPFAQVAAVDAALGTSRLAIVDAEALRNAGACIPIGLAWETVLSGAANALRANPELRALAQCEAVMVLFGHEAVLIARRDGTASAVVVAHCAEGDLRRALPGERPGADEHFAADVAARVAEVGMEAALADRPTLLLLRQERGACTLRVDGDELRSVPTGRTACTTCEGLVPAAGPWSFLDQWSTARVEETARKIVFEGLAATPDVPVAMFGPLCAITPREIDDIAEVQRQLRDYVNRADPPRPLSLGVFGPPGSGKSFVVRALAEGVGPGLFREVTANVALLSGPEALTAAFHGVRDASAGHKVPLVFFDEFDTPLAGRALGWLALFLAPMQDAIYRDGATEHPIGRCVFVFAGGVHSTFESFEGEASRDATAKGPDFLSRLRGALDVAPIDPAPNQPVSRDLLLRRAILVRALIKQRASHIMEGSHARIHPSVLRAILHVRRWHHSVRSIEALFDMSVLAGVRTFVPACLPASDTLSLHVDATEFMKWVQLDELGPVRDVLAERLHERHLQSTLRDPMRYAKEATVPWASLPEELRESHRRQADFLFSQLESIGWSLDPLGEVRISLSLDDVEILASREHHRWVEERKALGWTLGPPDEANRVTPFLVPWDELDPATRQVDRDAVLSIPELMQMARGSNTAAASGAEQR